MLSQLLVAAWVGVWFVVFFVFFFLWKSSSLRKHMERKLLSEQDPKFVKWLIALTRHQTCQTQLYVLHFPVLLASHSLALLSSYAVLSLPLPQKKVFMTFMTVTWRCTVLHFFWRRFSLPGIRAAAFVWSPNYFRFFPCRVWGIWWHTGLLPCLKFDVSCDQIWLVSYDI